MSIPRAGSARLALVTLVTAVAACASPAVPTSPAGTVTVAPAAMSAATPATLAPEGPTETATVVRVVDGDTLVIDRGRGNERVRYIGIDAPESVRPDTPVEFMGSDAAVANGALVEGREVVLELDVSEADRFGRLLRYVWLRDGDAWRLVNLELVRQGYAQAVSFPPDVRRQDELRAAEREARDAGHGLWGPATPLP